MDDHLMTLVQSEKPFQESASIRIVSKDLYVTP